VPNAPDLLSVRRNKTIGLVRTDLVTLDLLPPEPDDTDVVALFWNVYVPRVGR
jgi:hypothetical protein